MSAAAAPSGGSKKELESDVELNLASIIDCFTVLITYMLAAASFISLGVLDAGIATSPSATTQSQANTAASPDAILSLELHSDHELVIRLQGAKEETFRIPASAEGKWEIDGATSQLQKLKSQYPQLSQLILIADNSVEYLDLVKIADNARKILPIFLASSESI